LLSIFAALAIAETCVPTFSGGPGPVYKENAPVKSKYVCDPLPSGLPPKLWVMDYDACNGSLFSVCVRRKVADGKLLVVKGKVKSSKDCSGIGSADIELWQASSDGFYGTIHPGEDDGFCRSIIKSNADGTFEFETQFPGVYGSLAGLGPFGWDPLPYGPAHMHYLIHKPGYKPIIGQFFFDNDTAVDFDWRQLLVGEAESLGGHEETVRIHTRPHPSRKGVRLGEKDIVLVPAVSKLSKKEEFRNILCNSAVTPLHYCYPALEPYMHWSYFGGALAGVLVIAFMLVKAIFKALFGRKRPAKVKKS